MKVGIVVPVGPDAPGGAVYDWEHLRAVAETAEAEGIDSIWVYDHLLFRFGGPTQGIHEAWTVLSALAVVTRRVQLGVLVLAMPFRNPALLAKMAVTLDAISAGRVILGLGAGWHEPEFTAFGYPFDHRVGRFEEALRIVVPLVRQGRVTFHGRWHSADEVELIPHHRRPDGSTMPILIAGKRPRMLRLVAEHADAWNAAWFGRVDEARPRLEQLRAALERHGRDPATLEVTVGVNVSLPKLSEVPLETGEGDLSGSPEELAAAFGEYRDAGVGHLIASFEPATPPAVRHLARAAALLRGAGGSDPEGLAGGSSVSGW